MRILGSVQAKQVMIKWIAKVKMLWCLTLWKNGIFTLFCRIPVLPLLSFTANQLLYINTFLFHSARLVFKLFWITCSIYETIHIFTAGKVEIKE